MIRPPTKVRRPGTPAQFKTLLIAFTIRQIISIVILAALMIMSIRAGGTFWIVMAAITVAFTGFAINGWLRIRGQYLRTLRQASSSLQGTRS